MLSEKTEKEIKERLSDRIRTCKRHATEQRAKAATCKKAAENFMYWQRQEDQAKAALYEIYQLG